MDTALRGMFEIGRRVRKMTKKEQCRILKLEIENAELRKQNSKHMDVYRDTLDELITLRTRNELVNQLLTDVFQAIAP